MIINKKIQNVCYKLCLALYGLIYNLAQQQLYLYLFICCFFFVFFFKENKSWHSGESSAAVDIFSSVVFEENDEVSS